ncbi:O-linked N-acetylglucosamine transferase, SPINDLY family protein [Roseofilum sp. BLCC_M91]|uniref:O-linked N-acetylglucosamine transferase, SPINDLY family protein n=1 Tax=Roseofilum halophilum BLCC-M91 TaxID=3022259 RepID=A0ABT7BHA9_9CYAN|nr:hypothetical protein [Roseofilum halophilum]MDJ1178578.1 O-linked N-acetylglucosamine transferase, SPINDLY family protein [Roseofilum halophilum BLCC-M91]
MTPLTPNWQQQGLEFLRSKQYSQALELYQHQIEIGSASKQAHWYLGLALLLQGQEIEAQVAWMLAIGEGSKQETEQYIAELVSVLQTEADIQEKNNEQTTAWMIRQHIREIAPTNLQNLLILIGLDLKLDQLTQQEIDTIEIIPILEASPQISKPDFYALLQILQLCLDQQPLNPFTCTLAEVSISYAVSHDPQAFINILMESCLKINYNLRKPDVAIKLSQIALQVDPENIQVWEHLSGFYAKVPDFQQCIASAQKMCDLAKNDLEKIRGLFLQITGFMGAGGYWQEAVNTFSQQAELLLSLDLINVSNYPLPVHIRMYSSSYFVPYFQDDAKRNRHIHNHVAQFCQAGIELHAHDKIQQYRQNWSYPQDKNKRLKIGYLSHCFSSHSVGWLARWLFRHHNREDYDIYGYVVNYRGMGKDRLQEWYIQNFTETRKLGIHYADVVEQISQDKIDVLVDMDSLTLDLSCAVMAMKPAPIQVSWLGWDAPGIPTVDYMIADPYVVPDNADEYYSEKIWRLPQTYIAVDGFEVGVPTLRREMLDIPSDAVLFFSSQRGYKRHPEMARLQLKIIKEVPNSYFLIKGFGDQIAIQQLFLQLAEEEGLSEERLKFVMPTPSESMHRANMSICDVVLDTYPYNGATTTLETLWMGIPMVTRVGQQFAARNSYTMMINAGITEGIAWTDEEYVEWGIRFGTEPELRQHVHWQLKESRKTAPLWNGKQFAREMEKAYEQMWTKYVNLSI